ncbi:MAG: AAA family ATPase, partial [Candidatus Eremiobacteraeota bacterium]|nr:AAA family ATPase [Candidatus Eremiobacteraeota bacterium]
IGGLSLHEDVPPYKQNPKDQKLVYTFGFPEQQHNLGTKHPYCADACAEAGEIVELDEEHNVVRLKLNLKRDARAIHALIPGGPFPTHAQRAALRRIASAYLDGTLEARHPAVLDLLLRRIPRLRSHPHGARLQPDEVTTHALTALVADLDDSYLFLQGPPGSGKSTYGAGVIVDLLLQKKRVGVLARSHKAIHNLLAKIEEEADRRGFAFCGLYKNGDSENGDFRSSSPKAHVECVTDYKRFAAPHDLAAGTPWVFSREDLTGAYDYLFVDEAGQLALGDVLACVPAAKNVVLLGDPLQLAQVSQGSHPVGADLSVLEHLLGDDPTIPPERGVFLDVSYRMHPEICAFISSAVYAGRLRAAEETAGNRVVAPGLSGSGLRYLPVAHRDNTNASEEEADAIVERIRELPLSDNDILVVTPYNAQKNLIRRRLAQAGLDAIRVGTVDKFQGQQAAVVFYSMATSSGEDLPRDTEFLFERNRLNVAISRAKALAILVCSPRLLSVRCANPEQMALVNLLCRFVEAADALVPRYARPPDATLGMTRLSFRRPDSAA